MDRENAPQVEAEISKSIDREKLTLVGWYHSHPFLPCAPSLRDIDAQLDYQIRMKGVSDNSYTPCIGFIVCKYSFYVLYGIKDIFDYVFASFFRSLLCLALHGSGNSI